MRNDLNKIKHRLASNTFFLSLDYVILSALSLFFWSTASKFLLPSDYGVASTSINLIIMLSGLSGLGLSIAIIKLLPEYLEKKQFTQAKELIKFSLIVSLFSGLIIGIIFVAGAPLLSQLFEIPAHVFYFLSAIVISASLSQIFFSILTGYQNMKGLFFIDLISNTAKLGLSIVLMFFGFKFLGPIIGFGVGTVLVLLLRFRLLPKLDLSVKNIDKKNILFEYAIPSFIVTISTILLTNGQITILSLIKSPEVTGIFSVAFILSNVLIMVFRILSRALFPITSQLSARSGSNTTQVYFINLVLKYGLFVSIPVLIFFNMFSDKLILLFSGPEYLAASELIPIISAAAVLYGISVVFNSTIYAIGKPKIQRNISIISSIIFLLLAIPLTYFFSANGMSYAYLIYSVLLITFSIYNIKKFLKFQLPYESLAKIIISGLITYGFLLVIPSNLNFFEEILFAVASSVIYVSILLILKFITSDDLKIVRYFSNKSPIFKKQFNYIIDHIPRSD